jgi:1-acyl-sn-glycerol-3-phosphate acyltransferase
MLYRAVGAGMTVFSRARLHVQVEGRVVPAPRTLYVVTHRSNLDTPLACGALFPQVVAADDEDLPWFVVRDDLLLPGFFAHMAPGRVPLSLGIGGILEEHLRCIAIRPATRMRAVELARADPSAPLAVLPHAPDFRARAHVLGRSAPARTGDVLESAYADLLWRLVDRDEAPQPEHAWAQRLVDSRRDLERVIDLMRAGQSILISPEGTPSRDGSVGAIQRGVGLLVRRGRPERIVPIGLAFDPVGPGRTRGLVRIGDAVPPPTGDVEAALHTLLRRTLPRSAGAAAAYAYRQGLVDGPPPAPHELLDRLAREYESALS